MEEHEDQVPLTLIDEPDVALRSSTSLESIQELAEDIKVNGLIHAIRLRPKGERREIVAGNRRYLAVRWLGWPTIRAVTKEMTDDEALLMRLSENAFRLDVDPVDEALFIGRLVGGDEAKVLEIAKKFRHSEQWVQERLEILTYPDYLVQALKLGQVKIGVAKWLSRIGDETYRKMFVERAIHDGMSVWQAEYYYNQWTAGIYKSSADILPPSEADNPSVASVVRTKCEKCGEFAEDPNLRSVFIHRVCPSTVDTSSSQ